MYVSGSVRRERCCDTTKNVKLARNGIPAARRNTATAARRRFI
jgi:hypothetical protein